MSNSAPKVGVIMGSKSDWPVMEHAVAMLERLGVPYETRVVSAHRTPDLLFDYAKSAAERGLQVIVAGAGGAAHLPAWWLPKRRCQCWACQWNPKRLKAWIHCFQLRRCRWHRCWHTGDW